MDNKKTLAVSMIPDGGVPEVQMPEGVLIASLDMGERIDVLTQYIKYTFHILDPATSVALVSSFAGGSIKENTPVLILGSLLGKYIFQDGQVLVGHRLRFSLHREGRKIDILTDGIREVWVRGVRIAPIDGLAN